MSAHTPTTSVTEFVPYAGPPVPCIQQDIVHPGVLKQWMEDDNLWVPQTPTVWFKPCLLSPSNGYFVNLLRVRQQGILSRHRHAGAVHALVLRGRWRYLEHAWIAEEGSYIYEPPGDIHTLIMPEGVDEMITWFHNTGGYTYVDPEGNPVGYEDVFTKIAAAKRHYSTIGLGEDYINRFLR
jgi:2,4'-dihydroxyacetophenone dioxygenase